MKKAKARRDRQYPQTARVFSTHFPAGFERHKDACFVPLEDYNKLARKYQWMFERYLKAVAEK